jgi:hypothetical protein
MNSPTPAGSEDFSFGAFAFWLAAPQVPAAADVPRSKLRREIL